MTVTNTVFERALLKVKAGGRPLDAPAQAPERLPEGASNRADRIGAILAEQGKLGNRDIERILKMQQARPIRFGEAAVRLGLISVDDLRSALAAQYDLPHLLPENERENSEIVVACEPFHPCAEQIRALRTQLLTRWTDVDRPSLRAGRGPQPRMLAIVSAGRGEGRSYLTANLAVSFAQLGKRTLLVDADLRRPRQHEIFRAQNRVGLSAILSGRADLSVSTGTAVPEYGPLSLLPSGATPPNPAELLSGDVFPALLTQLKRNFEVLLFDTPATLTCADAQSVAFRAGSALVIARKDHTSAADTTRVIRDLDSAGAKIIGTTLNSF